MGRTITKKLDVSDAVEAVLRQMMVKETAGGYIGYLPGTQLERHLYVETNKVLEALGGKWTRELAGHLFADDPRPRMDSIFGTRVLTVEKDGFFRTPPDVVRRIVGIADLHPGHVVLEPSAGDGALADTLLKLAPYVSVDVVEKHPGRQMQLVAKGYRLVGEDFLEFSGEYDRILMNPPFEMGQDIEHVTHAFECLRPGGILVSVMARGVVFRTHKKYESFRAGFLGPYGTLEYLPDDAFKLSGTGIATVLVRLKTSRGG